MHRSLPALALAFCCGVAIRLWVGIPTPYVIVALIFLVGGLLAVREPAALVAALALLLAASAGILRTAAWNRAAPDSVAHLTDRRWVRLHGTVASMPESSDGHLGFDLLCDHAETRRGPIAVSGRVRVYAPETAAGGLDYGRRVSAEGRVTLPDDAANPGEIPPAQSLRRGGIVAVVSAKTVRTEPGYGGNPLIALAFRSRRAMEHAINATLPAAEAGLLRGLLFSDTSALPKPAQEDFRRSGTVHVLSTSGIHVALLAGLAGFLWKARTPAMRRRRAVVLLGAVVFFALMTGLRPAVLRAVVMTGAVLAAPIFDREADVWSGLALAAIALVSASPLNLLDPGFQLSFAAALGLAFWWDERAREGVRGLRRWALAGVATSVVASLATAPLSLRYFGETSLAGPLANLLIVPLVGPAMALGLFQGMLYPVAAPVAGAAAVLNQGILFAMLWITHTIGSWRWSAFEAGTLSVLALLTFYTILGLILWRRLSTPCWKAPAWRPAYGSVVGLLPLLVLWRTFGPPPPLRVTFIDVGQGDAALIQTPGGRAILVDAGGRPEDGSSSAFDVGESVVLPVLRRAGVRRLDAVVLSHPHEDHAGGLPAVLRTMPVDLWMDSGQPHAAPGYTDSLRIAREHGIRLHLARAGERVEIEPGVALEMLAPATPRFDGTRDDLNNNSVVFRLTYGRASFLFCGDAAEEAEARLIRSGAELSATVLKTGHHGSATSTSADFLAAVHPRIAVISCGRHNRYGHPAGVTLARLKDAGARVYRADEDGGIVLTTRGDTVHVTISRWEIPDG